MKHIMKHILSWMTLIFFVTTISAYGADLYVGAVSVDISPEQSAVLAGQFHPRPSTGVQYPVTLNILALETRDGDASLDSALFVSMDTVVMRGQALLDFRQTIATVLPEFDIEKVLFSATHTHSAPTLDNNSYPRVEGTILPSDYVKFVCDKLGPAALEAWNCRQKASFSFGLGHAVVAYNRRAVYADGHAVMYGNTNDPSFRAIEGMEDHDIGSIFFWDQNDKLLAIIVNVACPSQEVENELLVSADYWGPVRNNLRKQFGDDLVVVGLCGEAGDMSPHIRYRAAADERMRTLRNLSRLEEIARRITCAVEEAYDVVQNDKNSNVVLAHRYATLDLPMRLVTDAEYELCKAEWERRKDNPNDGQAAWNARIVRRYEMQKENPNPTFKTPINVLRLGDCVLCFNQFEYYTDFGIQIKARSKAVQTFVVQLTNGAKEPKPADEDGLDAYKDWSAMSGGTYLPSQRAKEGGGYGAVIQSNTVGPEGGQIIVEETLKIINDLWQ
ncbi:MAG: hypothetical protein Q4C95_02915 [Planctomycetia bacterium]|nr:hypothetical protein [Planctomycetia bacterium]